MATVKHKIAYKEVVKGSTITAAMRKAGYSSETAKRTNKLTRTKGWQELIQNHLSDEALAKRHEEQLNSSKLTKLYFDIDDDDETIERVCSQLGVELLYIKINREKDGKTANVKAPDFFYRDLALDKAYKLKARYVNEREEGSKTLIVMVTGETAQRYAHIPSFTESGSPGQA